MELRIPQASRCCATTEKLFAPGDRIVSQLWKHSSGEIIRTDRLVSEEPSGESTPDAILLCRWIHVSKAPSSTREEEMQFRSSAEALFMQMSDAEEGSDGATRAMLLFLALFLERKRILRRVSRKPDGSIIYLHRPTEKTINVADVPMDQATVVATGEKMKLLFPEAESS